MYIDSHAHYDDARFDDDRAEVLAGLTDVTAVINSGSCLASSRASVDLAQKYDFIYATVGVHPHNASELTDLTELTELCKQEKVVAVGEIGLDYHYDYSPRDVQLVGFTNQLSLAESLGLPAVIHSREAAADTFNAVKNSGLRRGVVHCYSGHLPMALDYIEMGYYIGIGGVVTYKNAKKTREVAAGVPLSSILIETDAPYLAPVPFRGKRNDSSMLRFVCEAIAEARGVTAEEVAEVTAENARILFGIVT